MKNLVIGVGNSDRGDDGAGPAVAQRLAALRLPDVTIIERTGDGLALIEEWQGYDSVVLIDAAAPGNLPGKVSRIDAHSAQLPAELSRASSHAIGVASAVQLAAALDRLPANLVLFAIEGANFDLGEPLSPAVSKALPMVAAWVAAELRVPQNA